MVLKADLVGLHTLELLQNPFYCARAAAAAHGDIELVLMVGHCVLWRCQIETQVARVEFQSGVAGLYVRPAAS